MQLFIVVICLNLQVSVGLFISDTNWLVPSEHASWSHVFYFRHCNSSATHQT